MEARQKLAMISDENITSYEQIKDKAIETDKKWKELLKKRAGNTRKRNP